MSSGDTRPGLQNPTPTSRARPVLYLRTAATFALAAPRRAGRTSRPAQILLPVPTLCSYCNAPAPSKVRLIRCTVAALTLNRLATLRAKVGPILAGPGLREAGS